MRKPRLTDTVMRGLTAFAAHFEAGGQADFTGMDHGVDNESDKAFAEASRAAEWIWEMQEYRRKQP